MHACRKREGLALHQEAVRAVGWDGELAQRFPGPDGPRLRPWFRAVHIELQPKGEGHGNGDGGSAGAFKARSPVPRRIEPTLARGGNCFLASGDPSKNSCPMDWQDEGALISVRPHGESAAIIEVFTAAHGRHAGVVRGGASRKMAAVLQPGSQVAVHWSARLSEHIGVFMVEPLRLRSGLMEDRLGLTGLNAICALLHVALPEREAHPGLWRATMALLDALERDLDWPGQYLRWELALLEEIGFGLDLGRCAVTGSREGLVYVSPRTGRAVSAAGAGGWAARLLPLPQVLMGQGPATGTELQEGLAVTGHFLAKGLEPLLNDRPLPVARQRLIDLLASRG